MSQLEIQFNSLINQNRGIVYSIVNKHCQREADKEDWFQDIVMNAWIYFPSFRWECKFSTWLYRVALHVALSKFKSLKDRVRPILLSNVFYEITDANDVAVSTAAKMDCARCVS